MQKARSFLLFLISALFFVSCNAGESAELAITETVISALATEVAAQITELPTLTPTMTATQTATPLPTATSTVTQTPTVTPTSTPTLWYRPVGTSQLAEGERYGLVADVPVVLYTSVEEAAQKGERLRTLPGEEVYVTFTNVRTIEDIDYAEVEPGGWISIAGITEFTPSLYAGLIVDDFPVGGFGWTLETVVSVSQVPTEDDSGRVVNLYDRYEILSVLSVETDAQRQRWFEINPGEWIQDDAFAYVEGVQSNPTRGATDRWISVNLSEQYLVVYQDELPIFATLVSTGKETGWATGTGVFSVYHKDESYSLFTPDPNRVGNYFIQDVPFILYYQGSWALHGAYWHDSFGIPNSHGCINLSPADAEWLYDWANEGEWVILYRD